MDAYLRMNRVDAAEKVLKQMQAQARSALGGHLPVDAYTVPHAQPRWIVNR